jgi:seryl-tRNA synthetase
MTPNEAMRTADEMHCGHTACVQLLIDSGRRDCVESSMVRAQRGILVQSLLQAREQRDSLAATLIEVQKEKLAVEAELDEARKIVGGDTSDTAELRAERDAARAEVERLKGRLRSTNQILVECICASGPDAAEDAAQRAVAEIDRLRADHKHVSEQWDLMSSTLAKVCKILGADLDSIEATAGFAADALRDRLDHRAVLDCGMPAIQSPLPAEVPAQPIAEEVDLA